MGTKCSQVQKSLPRHCKGSLEAKMCLLLHPLAADGKEPRAKCKFHGRRQIALVEAHINRKYIQEKGQVCGVKS